MSTYTRRAVANKLSVPDDVLILILFETVKLYWDDYGKQLEDPESRSSVKFYTHVRLSHVCRQWRAVAIQSARLWTSIVITGRIDVVDLLMQRARHFPLDIRAYSWPDPRKIGDRVQLALYLVRPISVRRRVRSLEILPRTKDLHKVISEFASPWPNLESLKIRSEEDCHQTSIFPWQHLANLPKLTSLSLHMYDFLSSSLRFGTVFPGLTDLSLSGSATYPQARVRTSSDVLSRLPSLKYLFVDYVDLITRPIGLDLDDNHAASGQVAPDAHNKHITCPHLEDVLIQHQAQQVAAYLAVLRFPNSANVVLSAHLSGITCEGFPRTHPSISPSDSHQLVNISQMLSRSLDGENVRRSEAHPLQPRTLYLRYEKPSHFLRTLHVKRVVRWHSGKFLPQVTIYGYSYPQRPWAEGNTSQQDHACARFQVGLTHREAVDPKSPGRFYTMEDAIEVFCSSLPLQHLTTLILDLDDVAAIHDPPNLVSNQEENPQARPAYLAHAFANAIALERLQVRGIHMNYLRSFLQPRSRSGDIPGIDSLPFPALEELVIDSVDFNLQLCYRYNPDRCPFRDNLEWHPCQMEDLVDILNIRQMEPYCAKLKKVTLLNCYGLLEHEEEMRTLANVVGEVEVI
ncbi:hypothetical protein EIP91_009365 [Steccherinum ochraceum]|uniref:F-box domain-containing protein n=1 Tax=Steccherinum ochraceum TaxID=92696 RepID=A0A4R0RB80_9APHY|nr:hypothetical protein EIP91_009365 [Steccherinum ochraceum]